MDVLTKIAGNKVIKDLAFKQIKKMIKEENISMIVIYVDNNNEITAKTYTDPMVIIKQSDYATMLNQLNEPADK